MATAAKRVTGSKKAAQGGISGFVSALPTLPSRFRGYVDGLQREMRLVTWPSRSQVQATTVVVLATVFAFALFFGVVDYLLALGQTNLYQQFTR